MGVAFAAVLVAGCGGSLDVPVRQRSAVPDATFGPSGPTQMARVVHVTDGDTIRVVTAGDEQRVRYIGIDTPERSGPDVLVELQALEATVANTRLVDGERVVLERDVSETDRYGRLLRYVWLAPDRGNKATDDDAWRMVNLELVRMGLAQAKEYPPDVRYADLLEEAESAARGARRGIWAEP